MTYPPLDAIDEKMRQNRMNARDTIEGPRIGDYIRFPCGQLERFSHNWGDGFQTSLGGNTILNANGYASFTNGGLNPIVPREEMTPTDELKDGVFWFFHHDYRGPGRAVFFTIPCRVYVTTTPYTGYDAKRKQQTNDFPTAVA